MRVGLAVALVVASVLVGATARANDSSAVLGAGGLVFTKSDGITMESEDLTIATDKVKVVYSFRNFTDADIETRVAFPVPEFDEQQESDVQLDVGSKNPMKFSVVVDGKPVKFETEIKKAAGKVSVTHHWLQKFPKGKAITVTHEYVPVAGSFFTPTKDARDASVEKLLRETYCVGPKLLTAVLAKEGLAREVHYILTTGANWKGPIGKFKLTIKKQNAKDKVSVCLDDTKRASPTTFTVERANFTPTSDLKILFLPAKL